MINYTNCDGLRHTIESVTRQECNSFEFIVIDGGTTDTNVEVIKEYANEIDYRFSEPNDVIYNAMNKGVVSSVKDICTINKFVVGTLFLTNDEEGTRYGNMLKSSEVKVASFHQSTTVHELSGRKDEELDSAIWSLALGSVVELDHKAFGIPLWKDAGCMSENVLPDIHICPKFDLSIKVHISKVRQVFQNLLCCA